MNSRLWLIISLFVFIPKIALASVIFTEVLYDAEGTDTDHEWVEIKNTGAEEISLSGWKFFDGSNHLLNEPPQNGGQGSLTIPANGFAILTGDAEVFKADHPGITGTIIDTVMNLVNSTDTIKLLYADGSEAAVLMYDPGLGANGDGNTLQLLGSSWGVGSQSPNQENTASGSSSTSSTSSSSSSQEVDSEDQKTPSISAELQVFSTRIFTGIPLSIKAEVLGYDKNPLQRGHFVFNLGDGTTYISDKDQSFLFTYAHPGEYVLSFDYYWNQYGIESVATDRIVLSVIDPQIQINSVYTDGSVEIENLSDFEIDLERWAFFQNNNVYTFPKRSILLPKKKMVVRTPFSAIGTQPLQLKTMDGTLVATYPKIIIKENTTSYIGAKFLPTVSYSVTPPLETTFLSEKQQMASTGDLDTTSPIGKKGSSVLFFVLLLLFGGLTSYILFSKQEKKDTTLIPF